jgi:hypothetical protein
MFVSWRSATWVGGLAMAICGGPLLAGVNPKNPPAGRFSDEWAEIYMAGGKAGYAHSTMTRDGSVVSTKTEMKLRLGRAKAIVELNIIQSTTETLEGMPVHFESIMDLAQMKMATSGSISGGLVTITTSQYGMEQRQRYPFPTGALMTWGLFRKSLLEGFKPGTEYDVSVYAPDLRADGEVTLSTVIGEWENFEHRGETRRGQLVKAVMTSPIGSIETVSWVDEDGEPLRVRMPMPGLGAMEVIAADQATAMASFVEPEIFLTTVIKAKRPIDRRNTRGIRYRLTAHNLDAKLNELPDSAMQKLVSTGDSTVEVVVQRHPRPPYAQAPPARTPPPSPASMSEYLEGNLMINLEDPKLIELASLAAGETQNVYEVADRLRKFVSEYVVAKNLDVGFATASEVARTREGDCSEHGILLAALGRARGIPSRVVAGLAYTPWFAGEKDVFGYHLWTQFWLDGQWVDYDAALAESDCSPARIAFVTSSLKNAGLADLSFALLPKIGSVELEILSIDRIPQR